MTGTVNIAERLWWPALGAAGVAAGLTAQAARLPGGWLIGPLVVAVAAGLARPRHPKVSPPVLRTAQAVIGMLLAGAFRPSVLPLLAARWAPILLVVGVTLGVSLLAGVVLARVTTLDRGTAALGTLPGGASGMISLSIELGADTRQVALMQYVRLVLVVLSAALLVRFVLPPGHGAPAEPAAGGLSVGGFGAHPGRVYVLTAVLAGAGVWAGRRLQLPAGALLGPLALGLLGNGFGLLRPDWPPGLPQAAYVVIGLYVGLLFDRDSVRSAAHLLPAVVASTLTLMAVCAGLGVALATLTRSDFLTGYLATTPGGMDSITVVALGSGADVSLMLAVQMARLLAIVFAGPSLARRLLRRRAPSP